MRGYVGCYVFMSCSNTTSQLSLEHVQNIKVGGILLLLFIVIVVTMTVKSPRLLHNVITRMLQDP